MYGPKRVPTSNKKKQKRPINKSINPTPPQANKSINPTPPQANKSINPTLPQENLTD